MKESHTAQSKLAQEIDAARSKVTVGGSYGHYKNREKTYVVLGLGFFEATEELCVIYQAQYDEKLTFIRPLSSWLESVEWEGETVSRFRKA